MIVRHVVNCQYFNHMLCDFMQHLFHEAMRIDTRDLLFAAARNTFYDGLRWGKAGGQ
jgi:hypothetical protein